MLPSSMERSLDEGYSSSSLQLVVLIFRLFVSSLLSYYEPYFEKSGRGLESSKLSGSMTISSGF